MKKKPVSKKGTFGFSAWSYAQFSGGLIHRTSRIRKLHSHLIISVIKYLFTHLVKFNTFIKSAYLFPSS